MFNDTKYFEALNNSTQGFPNLPLYIEERISNSNANAIVERLIDYYRFAINDAMSIKKKIQVLSRKQNVSQEFFHSSKEYSSNQFSISNDHNKQNQEVNYKPISCAACVESKWLKTAQLLELDLKVLSSKISRKMVDCDYHTSCNTSSQNNSIIESLYLDNTTTNLSNISRTEIRIVNIEDNLHSEHNGIGDVTRETLHHTPHNSYADDSEYMDEESFVVSDLFIENQGDNPIRSIYSEDISNTHVITTVACITGYIVLAFLAIVLLVHLIQISRMLLAGIDGKEFVEQVVEPLVAKLKGSNLSNGIMSLYSKYKYSNNNDED